MITIANNGPDIADTNYWASEHANVGLCYLSGNAGAWRLLVPEAAEGLLPEMRTGKRVTIEPSISAAGALDIVFEDGTDSPFAVTIDRKQVDRKVEPSTGALFTVWTQRGKQLTLKANIK